MKKESPGCLIAILLLAFLPVSVIVNSWVISILWRWFMVPLFHMHALSMGASLGVGLIVGSLTHKSQSNSPDKQPTQLLVSVWMDLFWQTCTFLLLGYIAKEIM